MGLLRIGCVLTIAAASAACTASPGIGAGEDVATDGDALSVKKSFVARGTGYYPDGSALEGGFKDRKGKPLRTLQQFLAGSASYVSVAMDSNAFSYGQRLRIKELDAKYGKSIVFRVVDTGGAFRGKGTSRIDICTANRKASLDPTINGSLHIDALSESGGSADEEDTSPTPAPAPSSSSSSSSSGASGGSDDAPDDGISGQACSSDGACNPGNDGSGHICSGGRCVPGCRSNAQCPGSTSCSGGQCS